jgi:hypothetical protein
MASFDTQTARDAFKSKRDSRVARNKFVIISLRGVCGYVKTVRTCDESRAR